MKNILIINGSPKVKSLCRDLAESYAKGVTETANNVDVIHLSDIQFNLNLNVGYENELPVEDSLQNIKDKIKKSDHLVIVSPVWWGSVPALLKGMLDRVLMPGFAFKYEKGDMFPKQLLKGRTARVILTMDTPVWYYRLVYGAPATKMLKRTVLEFCGFKPVKVTEFGNVIKSNERLRKKWIAKVNQLGKKAS